MSQQGEWDIFVGLMACSEVVARLGHLYTNFCVRHQAPVHDLCPKAFGGLLYRQERNNSVNKNSYLWVVWVYATIKNVGGGGMKWWCWW